MKRCSFEDFFNEYTDKLLSSLKMIDLNEVKKFIELIEKTARNKKRVYIMGNGGSAATANHMANDLRAGLGRRDILQVDAISLSSNFSVASALANDIGYENIFLYQIRGVLNKEDVIVTFSCSGNSENILKAIRYAKEIGATTVGITSFGGELKKIADINLYIPTKVGEFGICEDLHLFLNHIIFEYLKAKHGKSF